MAAAAAAYGSALALAAESGPSSAHVLAVAGALRDLGVRGDKEAGYAAENPHRFAEELVVEARRLATSVFSGAPPRTPSEATRITQTTFGPMLFADAAFVKLLADIDERNFGIRNALGARAAARAARLLADVQSEAAPSSPEFWSLWLPIPPDPPVWLAWLAQALWKGRWRKVLECERERAREVTPAFPREVVLTIAKGCSAAQVFADEAGGCRLHRRDGSPAGELLAPSGIAEALAARRAGTGVRAEDLHSVAAHRFLLWFLQKLRSQELSELPDFRVIRVVGGWQELERLGLGDRKLLARVVPALGRLAIPGPSHGREWGNLFAFDPGAPAYGRDHAWLELTAGTLLHPSALHHRKRWDRATLPFPELPPMRGVLSGRSNEHGKLATLRLLVVAEMQAAGADLHVNGGARIPDSRWAELMNQVGIGAPITSVRRVIDAWLAGGSDAPPFLEQPAPQLYHLHHGHLGARTYLDAGARMAADGRSRANRINSVRRMGK